MHFFLLVFLAYSTNFFDWCFSNFYSPLSIVSKLNHFCYVSKSNCFKRFTMHVCDTSIFSAYPRVDYCSSLSENISEWNVANQFLYGRSFKNSSLYSANNFLWSCNQIFSLGKFKNKTCVQSNINYECNIFTTWQSK